MRDLFQRMADHLKQECGYTSKWDDRDRVRDQAKANEGDVYPLLLVADWLGRNPEAADWLERELKELRAVVDTRGGDPVGHPRRLASGIFRVCFNPSSAEFVDCRLVEAVGGLLQVQRVGQKDGEGRPRPGVMTAVTLASVHPDDRDAVEAMARARPQFDADLVWDDESQAYPPAEMPPAPASEHESAGDPQGFGGGNFKMG
jgi:hypothetical protein